MNILRYNVTLKEQKAVSCIKAFFFVLAYSIQGHSVMMISPSSESHQQVVAVGQPLAVQPQGTVMVMQSGCWGFIGYRRTSVRPVLLFLFLSKCYYLVSFT